VSSHVESFRPLKAPGQAAVDAMYAILDAISHGDPPYQGVALSIGLEHVRLPAGWRVSVPVSVETKENRFRGESAVQIVAATAPGLFPRFEGTLSISPLGDNGSELWLRGDYTVPGGTAGSVVDATALRGAAAGSLRDFATWLAERIDERVQKNAA